MTANPGGLRLSAGRKRVSPYQTGAVHEKNKWTGQYPAALRALTDNGLIRPAGSPYVPQDPRWSCSCYFAVEHNRGAELGFGGSCFYTGQGSGSCGGLPTGPRHWRPDGNCVVLWISAGGGVAKECVVFAKMMVVRLGTNLPACHNAFFPRRRGADPAMCNSMANN